jgi:hypothetical protein
VYNEIEDMATETKKIKKGEGIINNFSQRIICQK